MHKPDSWYETPLSRHFKGAAPKPVIEQSTKQRIDPSVYGLAWALAAGAGRVPFIP
jgi:hypothetical protein